MEESTHNKLVEVCIEQSECTIYKVHRHLRDVNPKAYEPEIISIGPCHHGKDDLKMMEDHKWRYLRLLLDSKNKNVENFLSAIRPLESKARKSYAEPINSQLDSTKFIEMLVLDGCFIIELVRKYSMHYLRQDNDPIFHMHWIMNSLQRDLILFENQIPFFVLCKLFDLIEYPDQHGRLNFLLLRFLDPLYPGKQSPDSRGVFSNDIKHLLDLMHRSWCPASLDSSVNELQFIDKATGLIEANVKFQKNEPPPANKPPPVNLFKVEFRNGTIFTNKPPPVNLFKVEFRNGTIFMPPLTIEDRTDSLFRNLIAYEQYSPNSTSYVTDYVMFLDGIIDSSSDVGILFDNGIIKNWLGDHEVVANMVNKLADSVVISSFIYNQIFIDVKNHCDKRWNKWRAKLRRDYLNSPWAIISVIAAVILLLLTIIQTVFTILQVLL